MSLIDDLSDGEVLVRLLLRGMPEERARRLVAERDDDVVRETIEFALDVRP